MLIPGETAYPDLDIAFTNRDAVWFFGGPYRAFPFLKTILPCPMCGSEEYCYRSWRWHMRNNSRVRYRCDVSFKCVHCANIWIHGLLLSDEEWADALEMQAKHFQGFSHLRRRDYFKVQEEYESNRD